MSKKAILNNCALDLQRAAYLEKIKEIKKELSNCSESNIYLADKILTIGCLLKE
jgi:hypothetical protein